MTEQDAWNSGIVSAERPHGDTSRELLHELASQALIEKRQARRWGIFFKLLGFCLFGLLLWLMFGPRLDGLSSMGGGRHTAVVEIVGVIGAGEEANAESIVASLESALKDRDSAGVILRVNSPGGSPVQSGIVFDEILRLRSEYPSKPVYAVVADICASGAYYIAAAADKIFADKASIVGSIGVRMDSFGFEGTMELLGVERRLLTAGDNKGLMDPFLPENPAQKAHMQAMLSDIHNQFIAAVKRGRGARIADNPDTFSGLIWSGEQAIDLGLVDQLANEKHVAREIIGAANLVDYTQRQDVFMRLAGRVGASFQKAIRSALIAPRLN